jgi:single-strand DNA-binding protein
MYYKPCSAVCAGQGFFLLNFLKNVLVNTSKIAFSHYIKGTLLRDSQKHLGPVWGMSRITGKEYLMNNLKSVVIEGNLVRDPVFKTTPKGTPLCTFSLASNRYYKQFGENGSSDMQEEVSFFDVTTWAKLAESCRDNGSKGRGVRVVGRLKQERWQDDEGKQHSKVSIVAEHVEFRPMPKPAADSAAVTTSSTMGSTAAQAEAKIPAEAVVY